MTSSIDLPVTFNRLVLVKDLRHDQQHFVWICILKFGHSILLCEHRIHILIWPLFRLLDTGHLTIVWFNRVLFYHSPFLPLYACTMISFYHSPFFLEYACATIHFYNGMPVQLSVYFKDHNLHLLGFPHSRLNFRFFDFCLFVCLWSNSVLRKYVFNKNRCCRGTPLKKWIVAQAYFVQQSIFITVHFFLPHLFVPQSSFILVRLYNSQSLPQSIFATVHFIRV